MQPALAQFWVLVTVMIGAAVVLVRARSLRVTIVASIVLIGAFIVGLITVSSWQPF